MKPKTVIILVIVALLLIIVIQNTQVVDVKLFFWKISMSRIILIPIILLIGFGLGYFVAVKRKKW